MLDFSDLFGSLAGRALILTDILFYSSGWLALDQGPVAGMNEMTVLMYGALSCLTCLYEYS